MSGKASDFPTLALSRSGNTGISQPSTKKGTPSQNTFKTESYKNSLTICSVTAAVGQAQGVSIYRRACHSGNLWRTFQTFAYIYYALVNSGSIIVNALLKTFITHFYWGYYFYFLLRNPSSFIRYQNFFRMKEKGRINFLSTWNIRIFINSLTFPLICHTIHKSMYTLNKSPQHCIPTMYLFISFMI